jgi:hypothetical protein
MDWSTLAAAFIGGIFGGGIAGAVSFMQLRSDKAQALQARRWIDAEVVADAKSLLMDIDPQRRTFNANPASGVEADLWRDFNQRCDQLYRQLQMLAAGHPSQDVATSANELGLALLWTAQQSQFAVSAVLNGSFSMKLIEAAQERHATAEAAAERLATAVKDAAVPKRCLFAKPRPQQLRDSASSS